MPNDTSSLEIYPQERLQLYLDGKGGFKGAHDCQYWLTEQKASKRDGHRCSRED